MQKEQPGATHGNAASDRYLRIQSGQRWTVGQDLFTSSGASNFSVQFDPGQQGDLTELFVSRDVSAVNLVPAPSDAEDTGDYVRLDLGRDVSDSVITLQDHCLVDIAGDVSNTRITLGDPQGTASPVTSAETGPVARSILLDIAVDSRYT